MKQRPIPPRLFALAVLLIGAVNAIVLAGVAYNRSGTPEAVIGLSERELEPPYRRHEENSGLSLRLAWRVLGEEDDHRRWWSSPAWFTADKLEALGFDLKEPAPTGHGRAEVEEPLPKEVFIVLECGGPSYREALARVEAARDRAYGLFTAHPGDDRHRETLERAERELARERTTASRLFAVDAGLDPARLRQTYPDRARHAIARGLVRPIHDGETNTQWAGRIDRLLVERLHVPLHQRKRLETILSSPDSPDRSDNAPPRYAVALAFGLRFEPWIASVTPLIGIAK